MNVVKIFSGEAVVVLSQNRVRGSCLGETNLTLQSDSLPREW